jgi:hypothetical protein
MSREVCEHNVVIERVCQECVTGRNRWVPPAPDYYRQRIAELEAWGKKAVDALGWAFTPCHLYVFGGDDHSTPETRKICLGKVSEAIEEAKSLGLTEKNNE